MDIRNLDLLELELVIDQLGLIDIINICSSSKNMLEKCKKSIKVQKIMNMLKNFKTPYLQNLDEIDYFFEVFTLIPKLENFELVKNIAQKFALFVEQEYADIFRQESDDEWDEFREGIDYFYEEALRNSSRTNITKYLNKERKDMQDFLFYKEL